MVGRRSGAFAILVMVAATMIACSLPVMEPATPAPAPVVDCISTPQETCRTALADALGNTPAGERLVRVRVTCSIPECTLLAGTAQVDAMYSDGTVDSFASEWSGPDSGPPDGGAGASGITILPVTPTCVGVDGDRCREMAKNIIVPQGPPRRVVAILVTCTASACTSRDGSGTTRVTYDDGTTREADWGYAGN
jgi:hypothetical protein